MSDLRTIRRLTGKSSPIDERGGFVTARLIGRLGTACALVLCVSTPSPVPAAQLNITANECQPFFEPPENFGRSEKGIFTQPGVVNGEIVCSVPRMPDGGGANFYIDGDNFVSGAYIDCVLISWGEDLHTLAQLSIHSADPHYDVFVSLAPAQVDSRGFITLNCLLPNYQQGMLRGITTLPQPPVLL
jgi:hypothetical protein